MSYFTKLQNYVLDLGLEIVREIPEEEILVVRQEDRGIADMVLDCENGLLIIEQAIMQVKEDQPEQYRRLLQMNRNTVHGAFVLDEAGEKVIYRDTLQLENLDLNELQASINALSVALIENMDTFLAWAEMEA